MRECHGPIFFASMTTKLPCELRALPLYRQPRLNHQAELTGPIVRSPAADLRSRLHFEVFRPLQSGLPNPEAAGAFGLGTVPSRKLEQVVAVRCTVLSVG